MLRIYRRERSESPGWVQVQKNEYKRLLTAAQAEKTARVIFSEWDGPVRCEFNPVLSEEGGIPGSSDLWKD